jgi:type I restriction enzyme M protein
VKLYRPGNRRDRKATWSPETPEGRWRRFTYDELVARDKVSLDVFWLKDDSLSDSDDLPEPDVIAREMVEDLETALEELAEIARDLATR